MGDWPEIFPTPDEQVEVGKLKWTFECATPGCQWRTFHRSQDAAQAEKVRHIENTCPHQEKARRMNHGNNLAGKLWDEMDEVYLEFHQRKATMSKDEQKENVELAFMRGQLRGLAFAILELSRPHFNDAGEIARWAEKRRKWNEAEVPKEERTPTPAVERTPLPPELNKRVAAKAPVKKASSPASNPKTGKFKALKDSDVNAIKQMHGKFPKETIMSLLKITEEQYDHEAGKLS